MKRARLFGGFVIVAILIVSWVVSSRIFPPSYGAFVGQNQDCYSKIADACDELRARMPSSLTNGSKLRPDVAALPAALSTFRPAFLRVSTNRVVISVGVGRDGYGIIWEREGPQSWVLKASGEEGGSQPLYIRENQWSTILTNR